MYELTNHQICMISGGNEALNNAAASAGEAHGKAAMQFAKALVTSGAVVSLAVTVVVGITVLSS